jgi:hypothetical protein
MKREDGLEVKPEGELEALGSASGPAPLGGRMTSGEVSRSLLTLREGRKGFPGPAQNALADRL